MIDKKFKPTKQMINLLRVMLDVDVKPTITAFCEKAGISRETYYNWFENEDFVKWFNLEWELAMAKQVSWLDRVGLQKSVKDFRYWEAMQMKYGKFKRKEETDVNLNIQAIMNSFDDSNETNRQLSNKNQRGQQGQVPDEQGTTPSLPEPNGQGHNPEG